jgi:large subunit ribosomal protein L7/L12
MGIVGGVCVAVLVFNVLTRPVEWWHYVRTGTPATRRAPAQFLEPGMCSVELRSPGERPIEAIKALREVTGAGLVDANSKIQAAPLIVAGGLSAESADRVRDRLENAGATVVVLTNTD